MTKKEGGGKGPVLSALNGGVALCVSEGHAQPHWLHARQTHVTAIRRQEGGALDDSDIPLKRFEKADTKVVEEAEKRFDGTYEEIVDAIVNDVIAPTLLEEVPEELTPFVSTVQATDIGELSHTCPSS